MNLVKQNLKVVFLFFLITLFVSAASYAAREDLTSEELERVKKVVRNTSDFSKAERSEALSGGAGTTSKLGRDAFSQHFTTLSNEDKKNFLIGNGLFRKLWVSSPSSTRSSDGLGPLFNSRSCQSCHIKDGRGHLPKNNLPQSIVIKVGHYKGLNLESDKIYGKQFQSFAVPGLSREVDFKIFREEFTISLKNNIFHNLSKVNFKPIRFYYGDINENNSISARVSPQVIGMGLLESITEEDILLKHDPQDNDKNGISGRANWIIEKETNNKRVGRFGHRATSPSLILQSANAFVHDMGISNPLRDNAYGDCTNHQIDCKKFPTGIQLDIGKTEASDLTLNKIDFYLSGLSPPKRRDVSDKNVLNGKQLFYKVGCTSCHTPKYVTSKNAKFPFLSFQLIWPYTDLLLHDMGAELADYTFNNKETNREWRTAPLWGIGLAKTVNPNATFLHDGRAKTILEAIYWHGGEAANSRQKVFSSNQRDIDDLIIFLNSL